jgi:putative endopeptidase
MQQKHLSKKYYVQFDNFRVVQEKVYYELIEIIKETIKQPSKTERQQQAIRNVFQSFQSLSSAKALFHIQQEIKNIDSFIGGAHPSLFKLLAHINKNEVVSWGCPLTWSLIPNIYNASKYIQNIGLPILSVYDYRIYDLLDKNKPKNVVELQRKYTDYLKRLFQYGLKVTNNESAKYASYIFECECDMYSAMGCFEIKKDSPNFFNETTANAAMQETRFDWKEFICALNSGKKCLVSNIFSISSLNYTKCIIENLLSITNDGKMAWTTEKWRTYFIYLYLRQIIRFDANGRDIHYQFFGKYIQGQTDDWPREIYPVFGVSLCFNKFLTNAYINAHPRIQEIMYVSNLAKDLLVVFKRIVRRNTWLQTSTKAAALKKLEHFRFIIGSPDVLREDPLLNYDSGDAWGNIMKITNWRKNQQLKLDQSAIIDIPMIDWQNFKFISKQSYIVNAFYTPSENTIYLPLGYLQEPFIDLKERGIEYNLAHVGYTIAHEISHALDDMGSKYDYKGDLVNWWSSKDRAIFTKKARDITAQYETFAKNIGITFDAASSIGENMADIAGLAICTEYLRDFLDYHRDEIPIRMLSIKCFFAYIAIQAQQKMSKDALTAQLATNPHPPSQLRANVPLSRIQLFKEIYNIKAGDKMWWHNNDTIW